MPEARVVVVAPMDGAAVRARFENVVVEVEIDARGWPSVYIHPADGSAATILFCDPQGGAKLILDRSNENPLWSRDPAGSGDERKSK